MITLLLLAILSSIVYFWLNHELPLLKAMFFATMLCAASYALLSPFYNYTVTSEATVVAQTGDNVTFLRGDRVETVPIDNLNIKTGCEGYVHEESYSDKWLLLFDSWPIASSYYKCVDSLD